MPKPKTTANYRKFSNQILITKQETNAGSKKKILTVAISFVISLLLLATTISLVILSIVEMNFWTVLIAVFMTTLLLILLTATIYHYLQSNYRKESKMAQTASA